MGFEGFEKRVILKRQWIWWRGWKSTGPLAWFMGTLEISYSTRIELRDPAGGAGSEVEWESSHYWI